MLNMQLFLEDQAHDFATQFPQESFVSPKATSYPHKAGNSKANIIEKLLQKKLSPSMGGLYKLQLSK